MKPFVKKLVLSGLLALLLWFSFSEHGGYVHGLLSYVYDLDYYLAEASDSADYTVVVDDFYWVPAGECQTHAHPSESEAIQAKAQCLLEATEEQILFIVVEIEELKDGPDAYAPEGYFRDQGVVLDPEGATHPMTVLRLKPITGSLAGFNGGPYKEYQQDFEKRIDYGSVSKLIMPKELH